MTRRPEVSKSIDQLQLDEFDSFSAVISTCGWEGGAIWESDKSWRPSPQKNGETLHILYTIQGILDVRSSVTPQKQRITAFVGIDLENLPFK